MQELKWQKADVGNEDELEKLEEVEKEDMVKEDVVKEDKATKQVEEGEAKKTTNRQVADGSMDRKVEVEAWLDGMRDGVEVVADEGVP